MTDLKDLPDTMLAVQVVEFNKPYKIDQIPTPKKLRENDVLVKVAVASLCHTDFMVTDGIFQEPLPHTASHEGSGTIVAVGSSVSQVKAGDRVMCSLTRGRCRKCNDCTGPESRSQYCDDKEPGMGVFGDGFFAEYAVCDGREVCKLPDKVSFETAAPMACAGCTVWRGVVEAEDIVKHGNFGGNIEGGGGYIAIVGSGGGLGHLGIQFAKAKGLKVVGVDARDEGLALSKQAGADILVDAREGKEANVKMVKEATGGILVDAAVNVSDANSAAGLACAITRMHGKMLQIAQPENVVIPFREFVFRDVTVQGSLICSKGQAEDMLQAVAKHDVTVETNPMDGLKSVPKLCELAHSGKMKGKGIIIVDQEQIKKQNEKGLKLV